MKSRDEIGRDARDHLKDSSEKSRNHYENPSRKIGKIVDRNCNNCISESFCNRKIEITVQFFR